MPTPLPFLPFRFLPLDDPLLFPVSLLFVSTRSASPASKLELKARSTSVDTPRAMSAAVISRCQVDSFVSAFQQ